MVMPAFVLTSVVMMSRLRSNWCSTIFGGLICCSVLGAESREYSSEFSSSQGRLRIKLEGSSYYLKNGGGWEFFKAADTLGGAGESRNFQGCQ